MFDNSSFLVIFSCFFVYTALSASFVVPVTVDGNIFSTILNKWLATLIFLFNLYKIGTT